MSATTISLHGTSPEKASSCWREKSKREPLYSNDTTSQQV